MRGDNYGEYYPPGLWAGMRNRAFAGKRGQEFLRKLEQALVNWEPQALVADELATWKWSDDGEKVEFSGGACALGVLALQKMDAADLVALSYPGDDDNMLASCELAQSMGATWTMGWVIAQMNDELGPSPQERYRQMLEWVRACIEQQQYVSPRR